MAKRLLKMNVLEAARERVSLALDNCKRAYVSFSAGKDSTVMLDLVCCEARKRGIRVGVLLIDLEGQYAHTMEHAHKSLEHHADVIDPYWVCAQLNLRNAVSQFQPFWTCWDENLEDAWIRPMPKNAVKGDAFPFFKVGMEFEEFVPEFHQWYADGEDCACFVGIRTQESLNRWRTIASRSKKRINDWGWTTKITRNCFNVYPIYDWCTEDIWTYHSAKPDLPVNYVYELMHRAGVTIHDARICQPYGDDQRRGLYLFQVLEPETWGRVVARVNGANQGALYAKETGNILGVNKVTRPEGHTWESFAQMLLDSMPGELGDHYKDKIAVFLKWYDKDYPDGIPDEADPKDEAKRTVPSWRRVCKSLLRNDYWMKGLSFTQTDSRDSVYARYKQLMHKRRCEWGIYAKDEGDAWKAGGEPPTDKQVAFIVALTNGRGPKDARRVITRATKKSWKKVTKTEVEKLIERLERMSPDERRKYVAA